MKHEWEYKKLGDVCEIYQPKTISSSMLVEDGKYPVYGANGIIGRYDQFNHTDKELLMTCRGATCGTINISQPYSWINGNAMVIHPLTSDVMLYFLKYQLSALDLSVVITGAAQPQITRQSLSPLSISIPPIDEQKAICSLLDKLSLVIEKKKQQVKELDNLAQAIFYDMFGDPVENEKGWKVDTMGNLCSFSQGIQIDFDEQLTHPQDGFQRFIRISDFTTTNCELRYVKNVDKKYQIDFDDVVIVRYGASAGFVGVGLRGILANNLFKLNHDKTKLHTIFLVQQLSTDYYKSFIKKEAFGAAMPALSFRSLKNFNLIIPPFHLQQTFATKIEAIERQKELINQSIREAQTLFDSRMEYYFGE